ncbi:hypothetical protein BCR42DRAFT_495342 [Absidia repens]|uniref:Myb-like domain-containing protein n=1 Tax=Absidia repens TaxID=90262 RepID=A0A1X2I3L7_9FUNG|nr:hypothetical protein BCR42DRAFT_495342 [Absidia repens]
MSSNLTSVSINKNKSRFAPKVKSRPNKRHQASDAPTSSSSSTTKSSSLPLADTSGTTAIATAATALTDTSIQPDNIEETIRRLSSSTIPSVANAIELLTTSSNTVKTPHAASSTTKSASAATATVRRSSKSPIDSGTPIVPGISSTTTATTIKEPTNRTKRSTTTSKIETPNTPSTPIPSGSSDKNSGMDSRTISSSVGEEPATASLTKRQKMMRNIKDAMKKSDKTPSSISTPTAIPTKSSKSTSGNSFAAPSNIITVSSSTTGTTTATTPRKRRVKMVNQDRAIDDDDEGDANNVVNSQYELADSDNEYTDIMVNAAERLHIKKKRKDDESRKKRKKKEVLLAKDMKTLDDLTTDPLQQEDMNRDIRYFLKDLPKGVVTKQFRDEQIEREQEQLQRDEEAAALKNDRDALDRLAQQKLELEMQKEKEEEIARAKKTKEEEQLKKQQQQQNSNTLAESSHALQVRMVDGNIVLDTDSMMIDRNKDLEQISHEHMEVVEENAQSRKINFQTYGKKTGNKRWTTEETDVFYDLLSQFGTDFEMMAQMIPNRSRTQIRLKYNKEQNKHPEKVTEYMLRKKKPLDLETFKSVTGLEFEKVPDHFHTLQIV